MFHIWVFLLGIIANNKLIHRPLKGANTYDYISNAIIGFQVVPMQRTWISGELVYV